MADILLTRGEGANDGEFAYGILETPIMPEAYLIEKCQRLAATEVSDVRAAACKVLSLYHQSCAFEPLAKP